VKTLRSPSTPRRVQSLDDPNQDPYRSNRKLAEPAHCGDCGAIYRRGRWRWEAKLADSHATLCPACRRQKEHMPAGSVRIEGEFAAAHRADVLSTARNIEVRAKAAHPLERIMAIEEHADHVLITTTDPHLARGIGEALHAAFQGELAFQYAKGDETIEVKWSR
jgi:hypothetical protein